MALKPNLIMLALMAAGVFAAAPAQAAGAAAAPASSRDAAGAAAQTDAQAQEQTTQQDKPKATTRPEKKKGGEKELATTLATITVVGYSKSVASSIDYQRYSDKIENVVTAADITGLPSQSIADALTQLPGVATQRVSGQDSEINLRGLTGNFIATTLNGRMQPSTSGSNFVEFSDYPAELISRVAVYKSSQANVLEGGVGGTIAMHTANPLDSSKQQQFNVDLRGSYNSRGGDVYGSKPRGYRVSAAYQGKFFDNTLGIGVGFAEMYQPRVAEQYVNEAYSNTQDIVNGQPTYVNIGVQALQNGGVERRRGYMGTVVWRPNEAFKLEGDAFYSKYDQGSFLRGFRAQLFNGGVAVISNPTVTSNGDLVGATVGSIPGLQAFSVATVDNDQSNDSSVFSGGLNAEWHSEPWTVTVDLSAGRAHAYTVGSDVTADPYNNLSTFPLIADQSVTYMLHGLDVGEFSVANPGMYTDLGQMALSSYGVYPTTYTDKMKAFRATVKYALDNPFFYALEAGVYARNHDYDSERAVWTYGAAWGQWWLSTPTQPPLTLTSGDATTQCWGGGEFSGFPCFLGIDSAAVLAAHGLTPDPQKDWSQNWTEIQSGQVKVAVRDAFFQADIDTYVGGHELTGNMGVRVVHTNQHSPGLQQVGNGAGVPITDGRGVTSTDYIRVDPGKSYTDVLPSLNLNLHLGEGNQLRFAAAKVMSRPPIDQLKSGVSSFVSNGQYNLSSGTSPMLDPMYATQVDLAFAHYFPDSSGAFVADLFFKHVDSFVQTITIPNFDFAANGYTVPTNPATGQPYLNGTFATAFNNTDGGKIRGIELQFQKTHFLPGVWSGLGVSLNYAYTYSSTKVKSDLAGFTATQSLPGLSRNVASAAVFYDRGKFSTRLAANYRSSFVSGAGVVFGFKTQYFAPETVLDYQAAWRFSDHAQAMLQILNLTDQPTRAYYAQEALTSTIQYFGRTIYAGVSLNL